MAKQALTPALYLVSTPIGNLGDMTYRAVQTLQNCDLIACEDTRTSAKLFKAYDIHSPAMPYHDHSNNKARAKIIDAITAGQAVALISDAGTPLISDPGYPLVRAVIEAGLSIIPVPGANAPLPALQLSGLPSDTFSFHGFLPTKQGALASLIERLAEREETLIFYESAKRINKSLPVLMDILGDRQAAIIREITKLHEESLRGRFSELIDTTITEKGEIVLVVAGADMIPVNDDALMKALRKALEENSFKDAVKIVSKDTGASRTHIYNLGLGVRDEL